VIQPGVNGLLVEPADVHGLAEALVGILSDRSEAERLGRAARLTGDEWRTTPARYAEHVEALVQAVLAG
jgi:glycosyltransferase involved in cell wall biosynthesis